MKANATFQLRVECADDTGLTEKYLKLKDISPKWFERLFGEKKSLPYPFSPVWFKWYFELDSPAKCIIGEAHGYSSSYEQTCNECDRFGWGFGKAFLLRSRTALEDGVNEFIDHWNAKHSR